MLLKEVLNNNSVYDTIVKALDVVLGVTHAKLHSVVDVSDDTIAFEVEFEFPEHLVKATDVTEAGKPIVKKTYVTKGDDWKQGVQFGAAYELHLGTKLQQDEVKKLKAFLDKKVVK